MVSSRHGRLRASSANPPHRSTTVSPSTVTQNDAPTSAPLARFSPNATRTSGNRSLIDRPWRTPPPTSGHLRKGQLPSPIARSGRSRERPYLAAERARSEWFRSRLLQPARLRDWSVDAPPASQRSNLQLRPRWAAHSAPARLAALSTRATSSRLLGTGNETYVPRPPPVGRP